MAWRSPARWFSASSPRLHGSVGGSCPSTVRGMSQATPGGRAPRTLLLSGCFHLLAAPCAARSCRLHSTPLHCHRCALLEGSQKLWPTRSLPSVHWAYSLVGGQPLSLRPVYPPRVVFVLTLSGGGGGGGFDRCHTCIIRPDRNFS